MNKFKAAIVGLAVSAGIMVGSGVASASPNLNWDSLAQCESSGNPSIVSSNGKYHGLYQFDSGTWAANGGTKYAPTANQATPAQQTEIAQALYSQRGDQPWPQCGARLYDSNPSQPSPEPIPEPEPEPVIEQQNHSVPKTVEIPVIVVPENIVISQPQYDEARENIIKQYDKVAVDINAQLKNHFG